MPGWDCHGLPIEWKIEEQYRAKGMDKDQVPVLQFRAECRAFAGHWKDVQSAEFQRLGVLGDWAHPYATMTHRAEAQIVREIHKFLLNGLLYKGVKPVMWSVVEKTALAEAEIEYHDHSSTTLWVKFPVVSTNCAALQDASIVIWTTTPWTIPANRAIAYGDFKYCVITDETHGKLVVAADLAEGFMRRLKGLKEGEVMPASFEPLQMIEPAELAGTLAHHPFRGVANHEGYFDYDVPLYPGAFVTTEAGTGFVHIAPGHGEDDFNLGQQRQIKFDETVGDDGRYLPNVKGFAGLYVYKPDGKVGEANGAVIKALIGAGALLAKQNIKHPYPHSWRSKAPLIFRTTPQWFIAMDRPAAGQNQTLRELAGQAIGATQWYPAIGENRIRGMIDSRPDWCISRQRAWGVPIALFVDKKTNEPLRDPAVLDRIAKAFDAEGADAWYQHDAQYFLGDAYKAADYVQVFDIVDVWFESGSTHAFCLNQELGASEWPELRWPASLYLEGSDQHRGWFHSSLLEGCGTLGRAPFDAVLTHGFTLDEKGHKMSKSVGNVVAPQEVYEKMGADILRLWVVASDFTDDLRIGPDILKQMGDLYRRFRNTLRYLLGALDGFTEAERVTHAEMPELERWVLHRLHEMEASFRADLAKYDFNHAITALHDFCNADLSAFYFDVRKDSLYCDRPDALRRRATRTVLDHLFTYITAWLAPFLCFTAEEAFLTRHPSDNDSIHLHDFPVVPAAWRDEGLAAKWEQIRALRRVVTSAMELKRADKVIGSSLEAHPAVDVSPEQHALFVGLDAAEIFITSGITLNVVQGDVAKMNMTVIEQAKGIKCERCWQVLPEVGQQKHPDLCIRCYEAVTYLRQGVA